MCLLAYIKDKTKFTAEDFNNAWQTNPDGFGMCYRKENEASVYKNLNKEQALTEYLRVVNNAEVKDLVIHFRMGTGGGKTIDNVHPFFLAGKKGVLFHNGIMSGIYSNGEKSDTRILADEINNLIGDDISKAFDNPIIEGYLSKGNHGKFIIINNLRMKIFNEIAGVWEGENWLSNTYWRPHKITNINYNINYNYYKPKEIKEEDITSIMFDKKGE